MNCRAAPVPVLAGCDTLKRMLRRRDLLAAGLPLGTLPLFARTPVFVAKPDRAVILLVLTGGPSQLDTWDPKPMAPSTHRSPWRAIRTNVPGIEITELFPRMARQADKYALVRSVYHDGPAVHETGLQLIQTGRVFDGVEHPHAGGTHCVLNPLGNVGSGCDYPNGQSGLTVRALPSALPERELEQYGKTRFGAACLTARRMVEAGEKFVTVNMFDTVFDQLTWDSHGASPFTPMRAYGTHVAPVFDLAYSALLQDLSDRGLLESTLVLATGEFGRSPRINPTGGRDHWAQCWTALVAGGGVAGGQVYGSSDATGSEPKENPVHASEFASLLSV